MQGNPLEILSDTICTLIASVDQYHATDVHVVPRGASLNLKGEARMFFRHAGKLQVAQSWTNLTDADGMLVEGLSMDSIKEGIFHQAKPPHPVRVIRTAKRQIRARILQSRYGERLTLRFQPRTPPPIADALKSSPAVIDALRKASGLIVVCGPQGAGKSTFGAGIVELWANENRHIGTVEDPVEYLIEPASGIVTSIEASFDKDAGDGSTPLDVALRELQCADTDGVFIGEVRSGRHMLSAINVCGASEPVIITIHARSILDAILRILGLLNKHMDEEAARRTLSQCLDAIFYVDLAYTKDGRPVPVIVGCPFSSNVVRKYIAEGTRSSMIQALTTAYEGGMLPGTIRREAAIENAKRAGATELSINLALPPTS